MSKRIAVLTQKEVNVALALDEYFSDKSIELYTTDSPLDAMDADLCVIDGFDGHIDANILENSLFINIHSSLLPAFDCLNPIDKAFEMGVKVSGITICYMNSDNTNGKIIAQYPVFIDMTMTKQDFEDELHKIKNKLVPFVAESLLEDKIFDFSELLKHQSCQGSCGNCH